MKCWFHCLLLCWYPPSHVVLVDDDFSHQATLERSLLWVMMWGPDRRLRTVVVKNLAGHASRNRKTAYMVSIAVAFIIFAGAMFTLQTASIADTVKMLLGADLVVVSGGNAASHSLPQVCGGN